LLADKAVITSEFTERKEVEIILKVFVFNKTEGQQRPSP
jgi:hypothetical protein